ncbi:MAG: Z1 domain-containing protein [Bacilli bacterium]
MEEYIRDQLKEQCSDSVNYGKFTNEIFKNQVDSYGEESAKSTRENVLKIFEESKTFQNEEGVKRNLLLIGKVQSGKTSNLEMFTALAFDNGYDGVIIFGGYDSKLLEQTTNRFRKTFDISETSLEDDRPIIYSTDKDNIKSLPVRTVQNIKDKEKPLVFISMKRKTALESINSLLKRIESLNLKFFIIDDEGDQASLNTEKDKKNKKSATYREICKIKEKLNNPLYLSVTATPQANTFLNDFSELKPEKLVLIHPNKGYTGAEYFHSDDSKIIFLEDNGEEFEEYLPKDLKLAINYFIIASCILKIRKTDYSDMIIHTHRDVTIHRNVYSLVSSYIKSIQMAIENEDEELVYQLNEFKKVYDSQYFSREVLENYAYDDIENEIKDVILDTHVILQNSIGKHTQSNEELFKHKIFVGGDLLQRGLTFKKLIVTYFTRWAKKDGNMDTNLQRARWFGYRKKYFDMCKIFTTEKISAEFIGLANVENDLWEQFQLVSAGQLSIDDIIVDANSTSLKPTRINVVDIKRAIFKKNWFRQKHGVFDLSQLNLNVKFIESIFENKKFYPTNIGRTDDKVTAIYCQLTSIDFIRMVKELEYAFEDFNIDSNLIIKYAENRNIYIELLTFDETLEPINNECRERSFSRDNVVSYLQQGPDKSEFEEQKYRGDSKVILDSESVIIQISKIRPKKDNIFLDEYMQYMIALYIPLEKKVYTRDKNDK